MLPDLSTLVLQVSPETRLELERTCHVHSHVHLLTGPRGWEEVDSRSHHWPAVLSRGPAKRQASNPHSPVSPPARCPGIAPGLCRPGLEPPSLACYACPQDAPDGGPCCHILMNMWLDVPPYGPSKGPMWTHKVHHMDAGALAGLMGKSMWVRRWV
jgi:hypothetical protein